MTMQCITIEPNATAVWNPVTNEVEWSGENTILFGARDDVTGADAELTVPFRPQITDAANEITTALQGVIEPGEDGYPQRFNNCLWACAVAIDQWPTAVVVDTGDELEIHVDTAKVAHIDVLTAQLISE